MLSLVNLIWLFVWVMSLSVEFGEFDLALCLGYEFGEFDLALRLGYEFKC
jgi:hypothetical protein